MPGGLASTARCYISQAVSDLAAFQQPQEDVARALRCARIFPTLLVLHLMFQSCAGHHFISSIPFIIWSKGLERNTVTNK